MEEQCSEFLKLSRPLSDGKNLKEKFEQIFGATRYIKALGTIKKLQKEQNEIIKVLQQKAETCEERHRVAKQETEHLEMKRASLNAAKAEEIKFSNLLEAKLKKLKEIKDREHRLLELKKQKDDEYNKLQQELSELKQHERDLAIKQGQLFQNEMDFKTLKDKLQRCVEEMIGVVPGIQSQINWNDVSSLTKGLEGFQERFQGEKRQMEIQLGGVRKKISELIHHETADVVFLEKEIQKLETAKSDIMCKRSQEVVQLLGKHPENDWFGLLDDFHSGQKANIKKTRERLHSKKMEKYREEFMEMQIWDKLERKVRKLKCLVDQLKEECGNQEGEGVTLKQGFQGLIQNSRELMESIFQEGSSAQPSHSMTVFPTTKTDLTSLDLSVDGDSSPCTFPSPDLKCSIFNQKIIENESEKGTVLQIMKDKLPSRLRDTPIGEEQLLRKWKNVFKMQRTAFLKEKTAKLTYRVIPPLKTELEDVQDRLRKLESDVIEEEETLRQLQDKENLAAKLIADINLLNYLIKGISKCSNEIDSFKRQQKSPEAQKKLEHGQKQLQFKISSVTQGLVTLENYVKDLDRFTSLRENLDKNKHELQKLHDVIASKEKSMNDLTLDIDKFEKSIRNKKLEGKRAGIEKVEQQLYTTFEDQRQVMHFLSSEQTEEKLKREIAELQTRQSKATGSLQVLSDDVRRLEHKIKRERLLEADDWQRECVIELRTTEIANKDLTKYYEALDSAIIQFHKIKMEEVNRIANEYWTKIYKGNDIDFIKIVSEPSSSETSARRSFNYRVVMVSDGDEMDMREHCSAGQKVLTSLIIRLALAETFCLSCGILALDEPTTNLDYENKQGLASALREIIEEKIKYKDSNFQLIIITHDEAFVEMLGTSDYADYFYRVTRDDNEISIISRKNISDLLR